MRSALPERGQATGGALNATNDEYDAQNLARRPRWLRKQMIQQVTALAQACGDHEDQRAGPSASHTSAKADWPI
jgi:hypothetical protein